MNTIQSIKRKNTKLTTGLMGLVAALLLSHAAQAEVRLPAIFGDHMVLQQEARVKVWGWADEGEAVAVTFRGETKKATAKNGKWEVEFRKLKAGGPEVMTVAGKSNTLKFEDVLVGDVWLAGGQSNMEFHLRDSFEVGPQIEAATNTMIHFFHVPRLKGATTAKTNVDAEWMVCSPSTASNMSAVGYFFVRDLQKDRKVPMALVESDYGGTPVEAWMRKGFLEANYNYNQDIIQPYEKKEASYATELAKYKEEKAEAEKEGKAFKKKAPTKGWAPGELYDGMIAPIVGYTIKGAIWYQGEANAGRAQQYRSLLADLINNWRTDWEVGEFPFFIVQLAPYMAIKDQPSESAWAELREAQLMATRTVPHTAMVVITDVGDPGNIHPKKKEPVGERLALAARSVAYGERLVWSGPIYRGFKEKGGKIVIMFDSVGSGLEAKDGPLKGFAICGKDHKFVWANAVIEGTGKDSRVVVSSPEVEHPVAVRYGWADCPVVNLWNKEGLPASPFRTDDFPMVTADKK